MELFQPLWRLLLQFAALQAMLSLPKASLLYDAPIIQHVSKARHFRPCISHVFGCGRRPSSPRTPQPLSYHQFADQRAWLGIANFGDVASNLAFAVFGVWGLGWLAMLRREESSQRFLDRREHWFYIAVFFGMLLTAAGSAYYHLAPDNDRLVLDRLPMTVVFMSLVAAMIAERFRVRLALWLWPPLLVLGILSVLEWHWSEQAGRGDLRVYAAVQVYAVLVLLLVLFLPARYTRSADLGVVVGLYVMAKLLESFDKQIFGAGHIVSGHTLKHLAAGFAGFCILRMLEKRRPLQRQEETRATI